VVQAIEQGGATGDVAVGVGDAADACSFMCSSTAIWVLGRLRCSSARTIRAAPDERRQWRCQDKG
jgi:hypothetical protein